MVLAGLQMVLAGLQATQENPLASIAVSAFSFAYAPLRIRKMCKVNTRQL